MAKSTSRSMYDVHPSITMLQTWITTLKDKTGRSLEEWLKYIKKEGPKTEEERRAWLKDELKLGTNTAWWLAERSVGKGDEEDTPEGYLKVAGSYVDAMYAGPKAALRPIHDALIDLGRSLGADVKVCPCKTIIPFFRNHAFAQIKPSTRTRVDFGLCLVPLMKQGKKIPARLVDTGGFAKKDRITHRFELTSVDDIDADVKKWVKTAYELDAKD